MGGGGVNGLRRTSVVGAVENVIAEEQSVEGGGAPVLRGMQVDIES